MKNPHAERGKLLAELFLQKLNPVYLAETEAGSMPYDYFLTVRGSKDRLTTVAVELKTPRVPVGSEFRFQAPSREVTSLKHSNLPVLVLVADTAKDKVFFNWAKLLESKPAKAAGTQPSWVLPLLEGTPDNLKLLRAELS